MQLSVDYGECVRHMKEALCVEGSFDIIERHLTLSGCDATFFYIDGFTKDGEMQRIMQQLLSLGQLGTAGWVKARLPYVEVEVCSDVDGILLAVLSGQSAMLCESFCGSALLIDVRTYPARNTEEPQSDRVMQGARDGFVETLIMNTALIRRRIRDSRLRMEHFNLGGSSKTDVAVCYVEGVADGSFVSQVKQRVASAKPRSLTLGYQSLAETLLRRGWLNPFPKIRTTERPDTAAAQLLEGSVLIICDTSPQVMILPTTIFSYIEQTDDFCFPPLTGSYLRAVRIIILVLSLIITPLWYLALMYADLLPPALAFVVPDDSGYLPILLQLLIVEAAIDGLKIASMNTPDMLSSSLSIVGALILGDFAVSVGWLCEDVILYMAFVAIANFAQQNHELGYAIKFCRVINLILTAAFGVWGFVGGIAVFILLVSTNRAFTGKKGYLYPLIPLDFPKLCRLLFRMRKKDD